MHKILADECIHNDLVTYLKNSGFDVKTVFDLNLSSASDEEVFKKALKEQRALLTFDRGFGDIFRFNIYDSFGVIIVLIAQLTKTELLEIPIAFFKSVTKENLKGKLVIIGKSRVRISER